MVWCRCCEASTVQSCIDPQEARDNMCWEHVEISGSYYLKRRRWFQTSLFQIITPSKNVEYTQIWVPHYRCQERRTGLTVHIIPSLVTNLQFSSEFHLTKRSAPVTRMPGFEPTTSEMQWVCTNQSTPSQPEHIIMKFPQAKSLQSKWCFLKLGNFASKCLIPAYSLCINEDETMSSSLQSTFNIMESRQRPAR